jgi:DNA mismatch repair protein MSH2
VDYFVTNEQTRDEMQQTHLRTFPDLEKLYSKFYRVQAKMRNNAQLVDCVKVYNMIHTLEALVRFLDDACIDDSHKLRIEMIEPLKATLVEFGKLKQMLEECIDIGKARQNDYIINPNFSPELQSLNHKTTEVK